MFCCFRKTPEVQEDPVEKTPKVQENPVEEDPEVQEDPEEQEVTETTLEEIVLEVPSKEEPLVETNEA